MKSRQENYCEFEATLVNTRLTWAKSEALSQDTEKIISVWEIFYTLSTHPHPNLYY